jgi:flagellin-like hook-associated protein FlgL
MTSNQVFVGTFEELMQTIGANVPQADVANWMSIAASGNWQGLAQAIDIAMGVPSAPGPVAGAPAGTAGTADATSTQWQQLQISTGLTFRNATDMLNAFVQGLHNPNAFRPAVGAGAAQQPFQSWADFTATASSSVGATFFSSAVSSAGGETIYQALIRTGFGGLNSAGGVGMPGRSTFADVRNAFYQMNPATGPGWAGGSPGLGTTGNPAAAQAIANHLNMTTGGQNSWLATRLGNDLLGRLQIETSLATVLVGGTNQTALQLGPVGTPSVAGNAYHTASLAAWNQFFNTYLVGDSEIVQRDVWVPDEATRNRGVALWFQIGANSGQGISVEIGSMSTGTLFGREGANHSTDRRIINVLDVFGYNVQAGDDSNFGHTIAGNRVNTLLEALDSALATATRQRSELGAVQNRLEFSIENLDIASENLSAANSRIRDADMAREMMFLTQANVLQQAAISMLAQANQAPQSVLQLLG